ncbi:MAG: OB-fold domain-containing protein [Rubrivivax sp.]|nr:OB-fold domain-containing protein [Rubrivivax sp.]
MNATPEPGPGPGPDSASPLAQYRRFLERGQLGYQLDEDGRALFFPRVAAPAGYRGALRWAASAGLGTVYATTWIAPKAEAPYNVALIDMDEGFRLMSRVEGLAPGDVKIGLRVTMRVHPAAGDDDPYPVFVPLDAPAAGAAR